MAYTRRRAGWTALVAAGWTAGCGAGAASEAEDGASEEFARVVNVELQTVRPTDFTAYVRVTGAVEAYRDVTVSAEESGRILEFVVEKGETVGAGAPLARIDAAVLRAQTAEAKAQAELARERWERQRQLFEGEGIGSEIAYLQARYDAEAAAARLANLEARLRKTVIRSPIDGVFDERYVDAGEMVAGGTAVARVVQVERLKVVGGVPERYAPEVRPGDEARITFDVLPGRELGGRLDFVGTTVDPRNRTFRVEVVIDNPSRIVKPQMVANVEVPTRRLEGVVVVPQEVVLRTEDGYQVLVADRSGERPVAAARSVTLGPSYGNRTVVESGLAPGDELIVRGHQIADPGDRLNVVGAGGGA